MARGAQGRIAPAHPTCFPGVFEVADCQQKQGAFTLKACAASARADGYYKAGGARS
jgi:hypothetical protein